MFENSDNVIVLDDESFKYTSSGVTLKNSGFDGILMAYADWCPHCVAKEGLVELTGKFFKSQSDSDRMYVINADVNRNFSKSVKLEGFPTFYRITKNGKVSKLENFNLEQTMKKFMN